MSSVLRIEEIAGRLQEYQGQLTALNEALDALKNVGELISAAMAEDRNALIGLALQMQDDAPETVDAPLEASSSVLEGELCAGTEVHLDAADLEEALVLEPTTVEALAAIAVAAAQNVENENVAVEPLVAVVVDDMDAQPDAVAAAGGEEVANMTASAGETAGAQPVSIANAKIIELAQHRPKPRMPLPSRRRSLGFAAGLLVLAIGGTVAQALMQGELFQRLLDLGSCDGEAVSANQDCALLAWMLL